MSDVSSITPKLPVILGITGASGAVYARGLLSQLMARGISVHVVMSPYGKRLLKDELGIGEPALDLVQTDQKDLMTWHSYKDLGSVLASGSFQTTGMVICPCSSNTLGAVASGLGDNLLHRAAQVTLKESRRLILLYREMPMSQIDLRSALTLSQAGAVIVPAAPGFYMMPQCIDDLVDFVVGKLLDLLGVPHSLNTRWNPTPSLSPQAREAHA